jgi:uncharacterized protein
MTKEIWLNLPVKDVAASRKFFSAIGFIFNEKHATPDSVAMLVGSKNFVVMLFQEETFKGFTRHNLADTKQGSEVLMSIEVETREEVDDMAAKAAAAGGIIFGKPTESQGWMYGCAFTDPDGHRWNILYMDHKKMPWRG